MADELTGVDSAAPDGRPSAAVLLGTIREYLQQQVQPVLAGAAAYQNRVAVNLLKVLEREFLLAGTMSDSRRSRLSQYLGLAGDLQDLDAELCRRIRDGRCDPQDKALLDMLDEFAVARLEIDNPAYPTLGRARSALSRGT